MPYLELNPATAENYVATTAGQPFNSQGETLGSFQTELALELGDRDDVDNTKLARWINLAYRSLAAMIDIKELNGSLANPTVADQPFYLLAPQVAWIKRVSIVDDVNFLAGGRRLEMISPEEYRELGDPGIGTEWEPTRFFRYAGMMVVYPTPTAEWQLTIDFRVRPDDLVDPTDSPILPLEFHEVILLLARHRAWRALRNYGEAAQAQNDALAVLRPIIDTDAQELYGTEIAVQPVRRKSQIYMGRL